ncbi:primosomal protein N' [Aestuariibacter sp. A3R04]|uniref:primosomal protein N' n=1 Tax=Aestuariibacter sp. A3R04 TaxID=2841571 RepID=UPI001C08D0A1|nr:primosomal protein N' [Aestuariibacter sp. A3R04]MBU3023877.1 primosomal protein N' [Aestuariibacter sp. A3R04]
MIFVEVAVPVPLRQVFTYQCEQLPEPGCRVAVPFGNRQLVGMVLGPAETPNDTSKIKFVTDVIDRTPLLNDTMLRLCHWLSQYYLHPIGEVIHTALPVLLRKGGSAEPVEEKWWQPVGDIDVHLGALKRSKRQAECLQLVATEALRDSELKTVFSSTVIRELEKKGFIAPDYRKPSLQPALWLEHFAVGSKPLPDREQSVAITAISQARGQFAPFLLEGVTGSGKTEVYLQAIEDVLAEGKQVLILVPEIGLTPQTVSRFAQRFGIDVGVLHSQLNDKDRLAVWQRARAGELGIVIGTRSAIFTPLRFPGMIIVDEEHDESFKQQDGLRYHARDLAVMRANSENVPLVLGSATPSLESLNNALANKYGHLHLTQRAGGASKTLQQLLDVRDQRMQFGLADGMINIMRQHLAMGNQVLVFVNRRGYAPALLCHHCGHSVDCHRCERPFTVHRSQHRLQCHHCGAVKPVPARCEQCGETSLMTAGVGTEQIEEGLSQLFPDKKQIRIDSDSVRGKDKLQRMLSDVNAQKYQLLVGTQILSKGHHFPHVTLVVIMDCDGALFSADFRASEKLAQLVTQLAGRAGRASKPGEMWLQTHNPGHPLLQDLIHNGYDHFARQLLDERQLAGLPPYQSQAVVRAEAANGELAWSFLQQARQLLCHDAVRTHGPLPCLIEKRQGRFRFMLVMQSTQRNAINAQLRHALPNITAMPLASKVRWSVDVDPSDFS